MAPEMFLEYKYTEKADLWSVGAIVYKILTKEVHGPHLSSIASTHVFANTMR
jgi:serine/threonine protein kinase